MLLLTLLPFVGWAGDFPTAPNPAPTWKTGNEPVALVTPGTLENMKWYYYYVEKNGSAPTAANQFSTDVPEVSQTGSWDVYYIGLDTEDQNPEEVTLTDNVVNLQAGIGWSNCSFNVTVSAPTDDTTQGDATQVELQVTPVSGQSFPYQTPIDQIVVGANMVSITVNPAQANPFLDEADEGRSIIAQYLKIDNAAELASHQVGEAPYRFAAKTQEELDAEFGTGAKTAGKIVKDGVTYYIKPILSGVINIVAGENELIEGLGDSGYAFDVVDGLTFNGLQQNLVAGVASTYAFTSWGHATGEENPYGSGTATVVSVNDDNTIFGIKVLTNKAANDDVQNADDFVGQTFYVKGDPKNLPEGRLQLYSDDACTTFVPTPHEGIFVEISPVAGAWAKYVEDGETGVDFFFINKKDAPEGFDPSAPAEFDLSEVTWSRDIPKGTNADTYYIYAKAADGATNYEGGEPDYIGATTIAKAEATLTGAFTVASPCYIYSGNDNVYGLKALNITITTPLKANVKQGELLVPESAETLTADDIEYFVKVGTETEDGITYAWLNGDRTKAKLKEGVVFTPGNYQLVARSKARANYNRLDPKDSDVTATFVVKKPTVTIETTVASATYPVGTEIPYADLGYKKPVVLPTGFTAEDLGFAEPTSDPDYYFKKGDQTYYETLLQAGTYDVYVDVNDFEYDENYCELEVKPATVNALAGNMMAAIENQELVFGETLPLTLKYVNGYAQTETELIEDFEEQVYSNGEFVAKMIKDAEGNDVENGEEIPLYGVSYRSNRVTNWVTTILPVGTWTVSADFKQQNANADFKMYVSSGTWTVTPRDINGNGVRGFGSFNPHKTYTSKAIELVENDFEGSNARYRAFNQLPNGVRIGETEALAHNLVYGYLTPYFEPETEPSVTPLEPGDVLVEDLPDYKIIGYKNNINAGTATVTIQGINNFEGTRDLTFTIDKARLLVYPIEATWTLGKEEAYTYDVDGAATYVALADYDEEKDGPGREFVDEDGNEFIITYEGGIKTQLKHYFPGDKDLDITTAKGFKDLVVLRDVRPNVGNYPRGLVAKQVEEADNYTFDGMYAPLTIEKGKIQVQVAASTATYQGTTKATYTRNFELANEDELVPAIAENWKSVVTIDEDAFEWGDNWEKDANNRYNAGSYTITATPKEGKTWADVLKADNYDVTITTSATAPATATLTVNPLEVAITAHDFDASYSLYMKDGAFNPELLAKAITDFETAKDGDAIVPNSNSVDIEPALAAGDKIQDVISAITVDLVNKVVTVTTINNSNYVCPIPVTEGEVTTDEAAAGELVLLSVMEDAVEYETDPWGDPVLDKDGKPVPVPGSLVKGDMSKLNDYNGVSIRDISLTLKAPKLIQGELENPTFSQWNKNEWHAMVLPFAVTAQDLSYAFGDTYVIVNVVDAENTTENDVRFMLPVEIEKEIPANTPFCVKVAQDFDYEDALTFHRGDKFEPFTIVKPASDIVVAEDFDNAWGYTFEGTYKQELVVSSATPDLRFLGPKKWYFIKPESTTTKFYMQPYTGYVNLGAGSETREVIFTFEEEDGSTTAIKSVDFLNGNKANAEGLYRVDGIKLQSAPTQKGVYIQDGKKFVK